MGAERGQEAAPQADMLDADAERPLAVGGAVVVDPPAAGHVDHLDMLDRRRVGGERGPHAQPLGDPHAAGEQRQRAAVRGGTVDRRGRLALDQAQGEAGAGQGGAEHQPGMAAADDQNVARDHVTHGCVSCPTAGAPSSRGTATGDARPARVRPGPP
jgi:hypothetical protein